MATDLEKLVVQLSADIKGYEREMRKAQGVTDRQARAIENRYRQMSRNLDAVGSRSARALIAPLAGIGAALSVSEVVRYADAWTSAKNSLAVAGVVGSNQADVLDRLYQSAQANAAPVGALADLFGKAAQASDNLGASQAELLKFSDGVATALKVAGTSAGAASGALTQLGQLLGQARVQAEEFNSINEGARPILMAVAHGLDEAGGSVSKLKALVNEGKVSGQRFFQAFLKGLPEIQKMASNATQTIDQGLTKVNNALTKYIGETDEGLGASQRLVAGLNALADNFDQTADVVLRLASVIAGALVGRSIAGMIAQLGLGVAALSRFTTALRSARTMAGLSVAMGGLSAAAGPLGLLIGGTVVGALALFSSTSAEASTAARTYAEALAEVEAAADKVPSAIDGASAAIDEKMRNSLVQGIEKGKGEIEEARQAVVDLFDHMFRNVDRTVISPGQLKQLEDLREKFVDGSASAKDTEQALFALATSNPKFQALANAFSPLLAALSNAIAATDLLAGKMEKIGGGLSWRSAEDQSMAAYEEMAKTGNAFIKEAERRNSLTKEQLAIENEIAKVRKEAEAAGATLTDMQVEALARSNVAADARRGADGKRPKRERRDDYERDVQRVIDHTAALVAETEAQRQLNPLVNDYGYAAEKARMERELLTAAEQAGKEVTPELKDEIKALAEQYALAGVESAKLAESQDELRQSFEDMRDLGKNVMGGFIADLVEGRSASEALANALAKVGDKLLEIAMNDLFGGSGSSGLGLIGSLFGLGGGKKIPGYAAGTKNHPGGLAIVGEHGKELVNLPKGSQVLPNAQTMQLLRPPAMSRLQSPASQSGPTNVTFKIDVSGARGNAEIQDMVEAGVTRGIQAFQTSPNFPVIVGRAAKTAMHQGRVR